MAVLIALSFGLLFLLVAMVVNIGFLVAAKINLQNAVDLAAYAGAAQQARYLSEIGKWNYEMRRNYKAMVFDYMIVLNGERKSVKTNNPSQGDQDFKDYITHATDDPRGKPWVCATLQRQGDNATQPFSLKKTCQTFSTLNFQTALDASDQALDANADAVHAACDGSNVDQLICDHIKDSLIAAATANIHIIGTASDVSDSLANYEDYPYNYNRRLIAWMLHDYRHLQTRIRGVHFGNIKMGNYPNNGRWLLKKDNAPTIFKNSPISVAAKVLNGYTAIDSTAPTGTTLPLKDDLLKNPIHNAAYATFKKNLIKVLADTEANPRIYHLVPKTPAASSSQQGMAGGCGGECTEFNGAYLRLDSHDVDFWVTYMRMHKDPLAVFHYLPPQKAQITNFPVGVAKDMRVLTYYTVVGTASTKNIPFNVFFGNGPGDDTPSKEATLVAVAAARPFGSRIGPYIDGKCGNLFGRPNLSKTDCEQNGLDYLYPFLSNPADEMIPNFSLQGAEDKAQKLGVKLCVSKDEYAGSDHTMWGVNTASALQDDWHTLLYQTTTTSISRWRVYTDPNDVYRNKDDGFQIRPHPNLSINPNTSTNNYFDSDTTYPNGPVHPFGTRDSVVAWGKTTIQPIDANTKDNYETYLDKYRGAAIYQFGQIQGQGRQSKDDSKDYRIYVFRYPEPMQGGNPRKGWDYIGGVTSVPSAANKEGMIERAFANAMAVNRFEVMRYIIPYRNVTGGQQNIPSDVMNYADPSKNDKAYIFGGTSNRDGVRGSDNVPFGGTDGGGANSIVKNEPEEVFGNLFPETYTAWRFGSRGYRVKLVNIQDLLATNNQGQDFQNPLENSYTLPDQPDITVDLSKIKY